MKCGLRLVCMFVVSIGRGKSPEMPMPHGFVVVFLWIRSREIQSDREKGKFEVKIVTRKKLKGKLKSLTLDREKTPTKSKHCCLPMPDGHAKFNVHTLSGISNAHCNRMTESRSSPQPHPHLLRRRGSRACAPSPSLKPSPLPRSGFKMRCRNCHILPCSHQRAPHLIPIRID